MGKNIFFLLLVLVFIPSSTHVQCTEEAFISVEIFSKGIDFAKDLLVNTALSSLTPLELPQIEKAVKIPLIGTVHITISNIVLYKIEIPSSTVKPGDTGLVFVASGAKAYLDMDWSYYYGSWLVKISDNGVASVEVEGMDAGLTVNLVNQQGTLELSLLECGCYVKDISIKMEGGASWLYQGIVGAFQKKIRSAIEDAITQKIEDKIVDLDDSLHSLPKEIALDEISSLNITFVDNIVFSESSISFGIDGLFIARDGVVDYDHFVQKSHALVSCEGLAKMLGIAIHEDVINSASSVYFNAGVMHWIVDKLPDQYLLNTAEWKHVIPQLYKQYPDDDMNLNVSITSPPAINVGWDSLDISIYSDVTIDVLDDGKMIPVARISLIINLSGYPEISRNNVSGSVKLNDFTMSLKWSTIGELHLQLMQPIIQAAVRTVFIPYANLLLYRGLPLPDIRGYTLHDARFGYLGSRIVVCTNIAHVERTNLKPLPVS
ncbi:hypothetical protein NMG60_11037330 [Bertholletia excelsa]